MPGSRDLPTVSKPRALNFQLNDVCNARCVMCNIWQRKRNREMSPGEFATMLSDPYFSELEHVGITGGEPTLRRDLPDFYQVLLDVCPKLTGASFITHGLDTDRAIAAYTRVAGAYRARGLAFHGMVSIDGLGTVHDTVRGRAGAFDRAARTLFGLKAAGIPTSACCTIVRSNVWGLWDLLDWSFNKTYVRFRVAEFINRLGNATACNEIRAFDDAERAALISFFHHLMAWYETDESVKKTYASIVSLLAGGTRLVGCPYLRGDALNVDCRGEFAICAPKGTPHPLTAIPARAVLDAAGEREAIASQHCGSCIHDYHDDWRTDIVEQHVVGADVIRLLRGVTQPVRGLFPETTSSASPSRVLVLGWYGTETIGDMAILLGLVEEYRQVRPETVFVVPSHYPDYTRHNLVRLGLDCMTTSYDSPEAIGDLWDCQTVIIGGGPLMDIPQITWLANLFERARALGRRTIIEGCGIGPVNLTATAAAIARIAGVADEIRVRDAESALQLRALGADGVIEVVADPAARWARRTAIRHRPSDSGPICVFARELTDEYPQATTPEEATLALSEFLRRLADWYPDRAIRLHAMHHFPVGGDDRLYGRRLATMIGRSTVSVDEVPRTPAETLDIMAGASFVVCMRFHSVAFAHAIGAPLLAIDYTDGGKVARFAREQGMDRRLVSFVELPRLNRQRLASLGLTDIPIAPQLTTQTT